MLSFTYFLLYFAEKKIAKYFCYNLFMALYSFDTLNSTNLFLKQNFADYSNFDIISADRQTDGYGRFKRKWCDLGSDNIFMSICLKFSEFNENVVSISQYAALILAKVFKEYSLTPVIKWPNDILINSKKISGILAESVFDKSKFRGIVLGLGVNLHSDNDNFSSVSQKATAFDIEAGNKIGKFEFINKFMEYFKSGYFEYLEHGFGFYKTEYLSYLASMGKRVEIINGEELISGVVTGINDFGMLILDIDGKIKEISSGDISF